MAGIMEKGEDGEGKERKSQTPAYLWGKSGL
jgi:hypothetical protein